MTFKERINLLLERTDAGPSLTLGKIVEILSGKGQPLILILLSLPFCQPLQIPGLSTPFGLVIALLGLRMAFGRRVWLPGKALSAKISSKNLKKLAKSALWFIQKARPFLYPRWNWMYSSAGMRKLNGVMIAILGIFLALPVPIPLSNLVTAWSIFLMGLGMLEDDGLFILLGYLMAFASILIVIILIAQIKNILMHV